MALKHESFGIPSGLISTYFTGHHANEILEISNKQNNCAEITKSIDATITDFKQKWKCVLHVSSKMIQKYHNMQRNSNILLDSINRQT